MVKNKVPWSLVKNLILIGSEEENRLLKDTGQESKMILSDKKRLFVWNSGMKLKQMDEGVFKIIF
ncbi:MAG: hypothetical protein PUE78_14515 [Clostridia bacterium]|jgi:hypothetical protein|nr:hypothetical protein [uncultured Blautia sp.]MDD5805484.1 hypothetical protein [Clostridia bacterium]